MPTFTTRAKLKIHLGISSSDTSEDATLDQFIAEVEASVLRYLKRGSFASASYTEYYSGDDREMIVLRHRPVTAVSLVRVDPYGYAGQGADAFNSDTAWTVGVDYYVPSLDANEENLSMIAAIRNNGIWPIGRGNIKVTYTAGYATIPDDLALAVNQMIAITRKSAEGGMIIGSETLGEYSYTVLSGGGLSALGADAINAGKILAGYREVCI